MNSMNSAQGNAPLRRLAKWAIGSTGVALAFFAMAGGTCNVGILGGPGGTSTVNVGGNGASAGGGKPTVVSDDHVLGDANATVTVIEYGDLQCPVCGKFSRESFPAIKSRYIDTGKIRLVFRDFPLRSIHDNAENAAEASECAAVQVDFFAFIEMVYANQATLFPESDAAPAGPSLTRAELNNQLAGFVSTLGGDSASFKTCANGTSKVSRVERDVGTGTNLGVSGTPTFFVDGEKVSGFQTADQLGAIIDQHLGG